MKANRHQLRADSRSELRLFIRHARSEHQETITFELRAPPNYEPESFEPVQLRGSPQDLVEQLFEDVEQLEIDSPGHREIAERRLHAKGKRLAKELTPSSIQERLDELSGEDLALLLFSDEPWIPWEMISFPGGMANRCLCEAFNLTRWLPGIPEVRHVPLRHLALVATCAKKLRHVPEECRSIQTLTGLRVSTIQPELLPVTEALRSGFYDGWHFAGHGSARKDLNRSHVTLDDHRRLTTEDVREYRRSPPDSPALVFLNACETGRRGFSFTGLGGWPHQLLEGGVGAFLGTWWQITDDPAPAKFAKTFYQGFLAGSPLGQAVRHARQALQAQFPGNPTWLAYTVYGHPLAARQPIEDQTTTVSTPRRRSRRKTTATMDPGIGSEAGGRRKPGMPPGLGQRILDIPPHRVNKSWTAAKELKKLAYPLRVTDRAAFEEHAEQLLRIIAASLSSSFEISQRPQRSAGHWLFGDGPQTPLAVQYQVFDEQAAALGSSQAARCLHAVESFRQRGQSTDLYVIVHNRDQRSPIFREEVLGILRGLEYSGHAREAAIWDVRTLINTALNAVWRRVLEHVRQRTLGTAPVLTSFNRTSETLVQRVPFAVSRLLIDQYQLRSEDPKIRSIGDPSEAILDRTEGNITLLLGEFGFGKTTAAARTLSHEDAHVLYVPAARIRKTVVGVKDFLFECFDTATLLEEVPASDHETYTLLLRPVVEYLLKDQSIPLAFVLDGLDESAVLSRQGGMQQIFNMLWDVQVPVVLAMRTEFWNRKIEEFRYAFGEKSRENKRQMNRARSIELLPWERPQILEFIEASLDVCTESKAREHLKALAQLVTQKGFAEIYGDIPLRPLFLSMVVDSVELNGLPGAKVGRARLFRDVARIKIQRDLQAPLMAGGEGRLPLISAPHSSATVIELAWEAMLWAAASMTSYEEEEGALALTADCSFERVCRATPRLHEVQDLLALSLHSLLLPTGRRSGDLPVRVRFAHRAFQEFFLAWFLLEKQQKDQHTIPDSVREWMHEIREEGLVDEHTAREGESPPGLPLGFLGREGDSEED